MTAANDSVCWYSLCNCICIAMPGGISGFECFACEQEFNICERVWEAGKQQRNTWSYMRILGFPPPALGSLPIRHTRTSTHTLPTLTATLDSLLHTHSKLHTLISTHTQTLCSPQANTEKQRTGWTEGSWPARR